MGELCSNGLDHRNDTPERLQCSNCRKDRHKDYEKHKEQMRLRAERERGNNNPTYAYERKPKHWIAWDTEAWGKHGECQLIQNSDGYELEKSPYLTIRDILPELTRKRDNGFVNVNVIFAGNYDFNILFRHENRELQKRIFCDGLPGIVDGYEIRVIPRKMMKIRAVGWTGWRYPWIVYDVFGFFSSTGSFIKNLEKWKIPIDPIIERGKAYRDNFPPDFPIKEYNLAECMALKALMEKFNLALEEVGKLPNVPKLNTIQSFHGAGALADKILKEYQADKFKVGDFSWDVWSEEYQKEFDRGISGDIFKNSLLGRGFYGDTLRRRAVFGGRIELLMRGEFDKVYNADINSCYPRAIVDLPRLDTAKWLTFSNFRESDLENYEQGLAEVEWRGSNDSFMGPFPFRGDGSDIPKGYVVFPNVRYRGVYFKGVYHLIEIREAIAKGLWDIRLTGKAWVIENDYEKPFEKLADLMAYRLKLKKEHNQAHEPIKLGANSSYGKMAQKPVGKFAPKFRQLFWSGYITAYGRSQLLKYCIPEDTILFATDGIYSVSKLDVPVGENLGEWELEEGPARFLLAGLYEFNNTVKRRGYPKLDFDKAFEHITEKARNGQEPFYHVKDRLFVGIKKSLAQFKRYPETKFYDIQRKINWNNNEKRTLWTPNGLNEFSYPSQTRQRESAPYDANDFDERQSAEQKEIEDSFVA